MGKLIKTVLLTCFVFCVAAACSANTSPGPRAWVGQPLDNSQLPLEPVVITAHASDEDGVSSFEFFINEKPLVNVVGDGGKLSSVSTQWNPQVAGLYQVRVRAVDSIGNPGEFAIASIQVGLISGSATSTPTPNITNTPTPAAAQGNTVTPTSAPPTVISDTPSPTPQIVLTTTTPLALQGTTIQSGSNANCRVGPGIAYAIEGVLYKDQIALIEGRNQDSSWVWIVEPSSASGGHCWVAVMVGLIQGNLSMVKVVSAPPPPVAIITTEAPPPIIIITTVAPPPTPPQVKITVSDNMLLNDGNPCNNYPKTTIIRAVVTSSAGIAQVSINWSQDSGASGSAFMSLLGGKIYTGSLGPFTNPGFVTLWVSAIDNTGQTGTSESVSVEVSSACIQ